MNNVVTRINTPYSTGPLLCPYGCGRSFKHATQKAIHVRKAHTGERPFVCSHEGCGRAFHSSGDLKSHERTHSGAREHICQTCGKALSSRNALKVHERALHTLDRPFKCDVPSCGVTYMTRLDLDRHMVKHAKTKAREEAARLAQLEKRAARAEKQVKLLREKQEKKGKTEKRERKMQSHAARGDGGAPNALDSEDARLGAKEKEKDAAPPPPRSLFFSSAEVAETLDANAFGVFADLTPVPPPGAVAYLVLRAAAEEGAAAEGIALDELVAVRRSDASAAVAAAAEKKSFSKSARGSKATGATGATSSHPTSTVGSDGAHGGDPTVSGGFAARDALRGGFEARSNEPTSEDDQPLSALVRVSGKKTSPPRAQRGTLEGTLGGSGRKRARITSVSGDDPINPIDRSDQPASGTPPKALTKRRVLERMLREAYEAATTRGAVPFQSWRRGLSKAEAERLEALAEAEVANEEAFPKQ